MHGLKLKTQWDDTALPYEAVTINGSCWSFNDFNSHGEEVKRIL